MAAPDRLLHATILVVGIGGCDIGLSRDLSGKTCGADGACLVGYVCDPATRLCVVHGKPEAGNHVTNQHDGSGDSGAARDGSTTDAHIPGETPVDAPPDVPEPPPPKDAWSECSPPSSRCGTACIDLTTSNLHCGSCDTPCSTGHRCSAGACVLDCHSPELACGTRCVDTGRDVSNCGSCGNVCTAPPGGIPTCASATCTFDCALGLSRCAGSCLDLLVDGLNCGACDKVCVAPTGGTVACILGACVQACPLPMVLCDGKCFDLLSDRKHCGSCTRHCKPDERCTAGTCVD